MNTNDLAIAMQTLIQQPQYQDSFNIGLLFGATVVAFCFGLSMLRTITGDNQEDL